VPGSRRGLPSTGCVLRRLGSPPDGLTPYDRPSQGKRRNCRSSPDSDAALATRSVKGMSHATPPARLPAAGRPQRARIPALINLTYAAALYLLFLAVKHRTAIAMTAAARPAAGRRLIGVPEGRPVVLQDGSAVLIRPVRSTDAALLADGFARLSAVSRQMRFLGVKKALSAAELRYFTDVDHHDHEALGALDRADGRGVGIARYIRDADDPQAGEIAVTIVDDWQGRGLGTELLAQLSDRACQEGIRRFTALADASNVAVAALLRNAGARLVRHGRGTVEYEITLARGAGGSQARVSRSAEQAAPGANSAAGSPGPERKCALPRGAPAGSYRARA
jgi:RimJ/RimL family protein N-acetyltransferase